MSHRNQEPRSMSCHVSLDNGLLTLDTGRFRRTFDWKDGALTSRSLENTVGNCRIELRGDGPRCVFPGIDSPPRDGDLVVHERKPGGHLPRCTEAVITTTLGNLKVRQVFRLYPDCPGMGCDLYLMRIGALPPWVRSTGNQADLRNIENAVEARAGGTLDTVIERLGLPTPHWRMNALRFVDITDRNNNLVQREVVLPYRHETRLTGNLLLAEHLLGHERLFVLKEAPCSTVQLAWPGCDMTVKTDDLRVLGVGVMPEDLPAGVWVRAYGVAVGLCGGSETDLLVALRDYQARLRRVEPERDNMIMMNTWGDRSQDSRLNHDFAIRELDAGARLGITHFQLDDGWQKGQSSNSAFSGGSLASIWEQGDYWAPHPQRFPDGLTPIVEHGRALGIEVCVWFNPSADSSYAHWEDDARTLIDLNRRYGIRTFKIDGVKMPDKQAERNLRKMFDMVMEALDGDAVFNLDVTAGRRYGYHTFTEYGNLFLENRYTDWGNYYPHWTLRNLWTLSAYVPAQTLQIEFLNRWRNPGKYRPDDPLAPINVPFDYCFAITMMAQPLAWFEGTGLPEEAFAIAPLLKTWRQHAEAIHRGRILPIGEAPCGVGWTGFQSITDSTSGFLLCYREYTDRESTRLKTRLPPDRRVRLIHLGGAGENQRRDTDAEGRLQMRLPSAFSFALYHYSLNGS